MPARLEAAVLDAALQVLITNGGKVTLCNAEPTNLTEANSTYAIATALNAAGFTAPLFGAIAARSPNGRQVSTVAISNAPIQTTGTATWMAILNAAGTALYAVLDITDQALTSGNTWSQAASTIGIPASP